MRSKTKATISFENLTGQTPAARRVFTRLTAGFFFLFPAARFPLFSFHKRTKHASNHGSLVQRELSAQLTEGLSPQSLIYLIKNRPSYPLRLALLDTSPFQKGRLEEDVPCAKAAAHARPHHGSLVQKRRRMPAHAITPLCKGSCQHS